MATRRADAERNREAVLAAAAELVERDGASALRIAEVAQVADVGAGTIYRSFGSRSGLLLALLDESERLLQEEIIRGEPPLGPGAPPAERLEAFAVALHELTVSRRAVIAAADAGAPHGGRTSGVHAAWRLHLANLLAELLPDADAETLAEILLATLDAQLQVYLIDERATDPSAIRGELQRVVAGLVPNG